MADRVVITGAGVISAIGAGKMETLRSLMERRSGIGPLRHLRTAHGELPCGEVALSDPELKELLGIPRDKLVARTSLLGIFAVKEALGEAGLQDLDRAAFISGTTVGGMDITENRYLEMRKGKVSPEVIRLHPCGSCSNDMADYFGGFSFVTTPSTACSSAANAMILGANLIKSGRYDVVVAGGAECLTRYHLNGFNSLKILDTKPCRPFDASRAGLNLGEGAGFVILEREGHASGRGAVPAGVLDGYANACDAFHQTASSADGEGAFRAMAGVLEMAGLKPSSIDYINAHGTGTVNNDASESAAIFRVFGDDVPSVSSTKSFTGHTTSASGSIETVICLLAIAHGFVPANLGWSEKADGCVIPAADGLYGVEVNHVLCNSFAFGGNDSSLLISKAHV